MIIDVMRDNLTINLLKYAAGQRIFCPKCECIMDWERTVICGGIVTCEQCWLDVCQKLLDQRGDDEFLGILARADVTSCRNYHVENGRLIKGKQLLTEL